MQNYIKILRAISEESRIKIVKILLHIDTKVCVCKIVDSLKLPFYTISRHMKKLKNAGILNESKEGKYINYSINKKNDPFFIKIFELINSIPEKEFENEIKALKDSLTFSKKVNKQKN